MPKLPDLEALAIFAKVVEARSFAGAAADLNLSKATVSKAISRLERKLGGRLLNRTSRRIALTDLGRTLAPRAAAVLAEAEAVETEAVTLSTEPRGIIKLTAPMSFGVRFIAPLLPDFLRKYPGITIDLHLSDALVDVVGDGFDAAIRLTALSDSSLVARKLCDMPQHVVAAPSYLKERGRPKHPRDLAEHSALAYTYQSTPDAWQFKRRSGEAVSVRPSGPLRVNNGEAMLPSLIAGLGVGVLPEFIIGDAVKEKWLEVILGEWTLPGSAVYWVTPPGQPRPKRTEMLGAFLTERLARGRFAKGTAR